MRIAIVDPSQMIRQIDDLLQGYVDRGELSGCGLIVRGREGVLFQKNYGFASLENQRPVNGESRFRMMSMSKLVTALAAARLWERGLLDPDASVSDFLPDFEGIRVADDPRYVMKTFRMDKLLSMLLFFRPKHVKTVALKNPLTIRTLLTHTCGIEQGVVGLLQMLKSKRIYSSIEERVGDYAQSILGFQPGSESGYSPIAAMDILGVVMSRMTGKPVADVIADEVLTPLGMSDSSFALSDKTHLVQLYKRIKNKLVNVTDTKEDLYGTIHAREGVVCCSGGLFSTAADFDHIAEMLLGAGMYHGGRFLQPETVEKLRTPGTEHEHEKGRKWGFGFSVRIDDGLCPKGSFGWSGAFGTHFLVSPEKNIAITFVTNRTDLNGSGSYVSREIERRIFEHE